VLALKPREFEDLQPGEFFKLMKGYEDRRESENTVLAYFVSNLMNVEGRSLKHQMTVERLMGPLRQKKKKSAKERSEDEVYLLEKFGKLRR